MADEIAAARRYVEAAIGAYPLPARLVRPLGGAAPLLFGAA